MRHSILFMVGVLLELWSAVASAQSSSAVFDGTWDVTLVCPASEDGAKPFTFNFTAQVKDSMLHGENGNAGQPGWMVLDGPIQPDGSATLNAHGLTGGAQYNISSTNQGVPYHHVVTAHFDGARGTGSWVTTRTCDFTFGKLWQ